MQRHELNTLRMLVWLNKSNNIQHHHTCKYELPFISGMKLQKMRRGEDGDTQSNLTLMMRLAENAQSPSSSISNCMSEGGGDGQ
jgi:hypothetical protein